MGPSNPTDDDELKSTASQPIEGPPEFLRAVELQREYWTHNRIEQTHLERRGFDQLDWRQRLRLHHLTCLQRVKPGPDRDAAAQKCAALARRLVAADSPYRPRVVMIWQGQSTQGEQERPPD